MQEIARKLPDTASYVVFWLTMLMLLASLSSIARSLKQIANKA
jgi:hypothetical protein